MLSIKKIQEIRASKKRKGFSFMEILVALIMIVSLSVGAFFTYSDAQHTRKMAQMNNDIDAIITGVLVYEALSMDSTIPATLADLRTGLTAAESVDGLAHSNLVTSTKETGGVYLDPWGRSYETCYSAANRTFTITPVVPEVGGTGTATEIVRHF